ncbi:hypothetical protein HMPREF1431_01119, partial [Helicobacter pylori GAMchJs106B]
MFVVSVALIGLVLAIFLTTSVVLIFSITFLIVVLITATVTHFVSLLNIKIKTRCIFAPRFPFYTFFPKKKLKRILFAMTSYLHWLAAFLGVKWQPQCMTVWLPYKPA